MSATGKKLMSDFGFNKFNADAVRIARILRASTPLFAVVYNSLKPDVALTQSKINSIDALNLYRGKETRGDPLDTAPYLNLEDFNGNPASYTFILHDLAGYRSKKGVREGVEKNISSKVVRFYELTINDFKTTKVTSDATDSYVKQRRKSDGTANKNTKLIETVVEGDDVTFKFLTEATSDGEKKQQVDIETKSLTPNTSSLYEIWLKFPNGLDLLNVQDKDTIDRSDVVALLEAGDIEFASTSPSFLFQGFQFWLTQLNSAIVPENRKPKRWDAIHGQDEVFLDKHTSELISQIKFFEQNMASQLQSELIKQGRLLPKSKRAKA